MQLFLSFSIILVLIKNKLFCILFVLCFPSTLRALRTCPLLSRNMMRLVNQIVQRKIYNFSRIPGMRKPKYIYSLFYLSKFGACSDLCLHYYRLSSNSKLLEMNFIFQNPFFSGGF